MNPHVVDTRTSNVPVCQFQHPRILSVFNSLCIISPLSGIVNDFLSIYALFFIRSAPCDASITRGAIDRLFEFECAGVQLVVSALLREQHLVIAALDDASVIQHHDDVGVAYR